MWAAVMAPPAAATRRRLSARLPAGPAGRRRMRRSPAAARLSASSAAALLAVMPRRGNGGNNGGGAAPRKAIALHPRRNDDVLCSGHDAASDRPVRAPPRSHATRIPKLPADRREPYRWRIGGGRSWRASSSARQREHRRHRAAELYFHIAGRRRQIKAAAAGDAAQYVLAELQIAQAHQMATGRKTSWSR